MNKLYFEFLVSFTITVLSFYFMYRGWQMLSQRRKELLWPAKIIFSLVTLIFGPDVAQRREEILLNRTRFYEISHIFGGALGFVGGLIWLISVIQKLA